MTASYLIDSRPLLPGCPDDLYYPSYRSVTEGPWSVQSVMMVASRGYWGEVYPVEGAVILTGPSEEGRKAWMSLLPNEIESQEIGLRAARGHVVVFGMGMGWLVANLAVRPEVERVTVVERDTRVLALIAAAGVLEALPPPARAKVAIVEADALEWRPDSPVDSLQADIWLHYAEPQKIDDVRRMQANVQAGEIYFWGQEMEIWRLACRRGGSGSPALDWPEIRRIVDEDIKLPLILPDWPDYPAKIAEAARWWTPKEEGWWR